MSWTKPAKRPINTSGRKLQAGINRMVASHSKDKLAKEEKKIKDAQIAEDLLKNRTSSIESKLSTGYDALANDITKFGGTMNPKLRNQMQDELMNVLMTMRDDEADWLRNNPEATELERKQHLNNSLTSLDQLHNDLIVLMTAQDQYLKARDIPLGEEGALIPNYNPELIKFFEGMDQGNIPIHLTRDDNDSWRISMVNEDELGNALNNAGPEDIIDFTSIDLTAFNKEALEGGGFFNTIEKPEYSELTNQIHSQIDKGNTDFGRKGKEGEYIIDKEAVEEFYSTGEGANIMTSISKDPDAQGNWLYYGEDIYGDDGSISRSNTINNFDPIQYTNTYLQEFLNTLPDNKPKPKSKPKSKPKPPSNTSTPKPPPKVNSTNPPVSKKDNDAVSFNHIKFDEFNLQKGDKVEDEVVKLLEGLPQYDDFEFKMAGNNRDKLLIKHLKSGKEKEMWLNSEYNIEREPGLKWDGDEIYNEFIDFIDENRTKPSSKKSSSQKPADPKNIGSKYN